MRVLPDFPHHIPPFLPEAWLQAAAEQSPKPSQSHLVETEAPEGAG
jgi:hypothetical protein